MKIKLGKLRFGTDKYGWFGQWVNDRGLRYATHSYSLWHVIVGMFQERKRRL